MRKLILMLALMLLLAVPSFARGSRFFIQVYFPPVWSQDDTFCSTPYIYNRPEIFYPQYPVYQPVLIFRPRHFIVYGGRIIR